MKPDKKLKKEPTSTVTSGDQSEPLANITPDFNINIPLLENASAVLPVLPECDLQEINSDDDNLLVKILTQTKQELANPQQNQQPDVTPNTVEPPPPPCAINYNCK